MSEHLTRADVALLRDCVRHRFIYGHGNAIICALEGFKWLLGEESAVTRESLEEEQAAHE